MVLFLQKKAFLMGLDRMSSDILILKRQTEALQKIISKISTNYCRSFNIFSDFFLAKIYEDFVEDIAVSRAVHGAYHLIRALPLANEAYCQRAQSALRVYIPMSNFA